MQLPPSSATSCSQSQGLSLASNSAGVVVQGMVWTTNILQIFPSPMIINSIQINTQGQQLPDKVLLTLLDANQQRYGPYSIQQNTDYSLIFRNVPSTPMSLIQIQFPAGVQPSTYIVNIAVCPQTNAPSVTGMLLPLSLFNQIVFSSLTLIYR